MYRRSPFSLCFDKHDYYPFSKKSFLCQLVIKIPINATTPVPVAKSENTEEPSSRSSTILPSLAAGSLEYQIKSNSSVCDAKTLKRSPSPVPCTSDLVKIESKEERPKQNGGGDGAMSAFTPNRITIAESENTVQPSISHDLVTKTFKKGNLSPSDPVL